MSDKIVIELTIEQQKALNGLKKLAITTNKTEKSVEKSFKGMSSTASSFIGNLAAIGAAKALGFLKNQIFGVVDAATKLEVYETQFETFLKSTDKAKAHLEDLVNFAATTPFQLPGIVDASKKLLAFDVAQEDIIPLLGQLGNAAAATGNEISDLALIFGQIQTTGKLTGERFNQLAERGVNVGPAIAKAMKKSSTELVKLRSEGKITADIFNKAFETMTTGTGKFAGGMIKQSKTFGGVISTLKDNFFGLQVEIGKTLTPELKKIAIEITKEMANFAKEVKENGPAISEQFRNLASLTIVVAKGMGTIVSGWAKLASMAGKAITFDFDTTATTEAAEKVLKLSREVQKLSNYRDSFIKAGWDTSKIDAKVKGLNEKIQTLTTSFGVLNAETDGSSGKDDETLKKDKELKSKLTQSEIAFREQMATIREESALAMAEAELAKGLLDEEKNNEKLIALSELVGLENAIRLTAMEQMAETEKKESDKKLALAKVNSQKEILIAKKTTKEIAANEKQKKSTMMQNMQATGRAMEGFGALASAVSNDNFKVTRAFALATIPVNTAVAIMQAMTMPPPASYIAAAAAGAMGTAQMIKASSQKPPSYQDGGIVDFGAPISATDNQLAEVASGELVLTADDQASLLDNIRNPVSQGIQNIIVEIDGFAVASAMREAQTDGARI